MGRVGKILIFKALQTITNVCNANTNKEKDTPFENMKVLLGAIQTTN